MYTGTWKRRIHSWMRREQVRTDVLSRIPVFRGCGRNNSGGQGRRTGLMVRLPSLARNPSERCFREKSLGSRNILGGCGQCPGAETIPDRSWLPVTAPVVPVRCQAVRRGCADRPGAPVLPVRPGPDDSTRSDGSDGPVHYPFVKGCFPGPSLAAACCSPGGSLASHWPQWLQSLSGLFCQPWASVLPVIKAFIRTACD